MSAAVSFGFEHEHVTSLQPLTSGCQGPPWSDGEQTLDTYLRSCAAELVLHGLDLGTNLEPPPEALAECGAFLVERAVRRGRGLDVCGRGTP